MHERALVILCADDKFGAHFFAASRAEVALRIPGGARAAATPLARAGLEDAVRRGVREVVLLAHEGCRVCPARGREDGQVLFEALTGDDWSRSLLEVHQVSVRVLWVDPRSGRALQWRWEQGQLVCTDFVGAGLRLMGARASARRSG